MEAIARFFQRFYYNFTCSIVLFVFAISHLFLLEKQNLLTEVIKYFNDNNISLIFLVIIFIFMTFIMGIFIEGIFGISTFISKSDLFNFENKSRKEKHRNNKKECFITSFLYNFLMKVSIAEVCKYCLKQTQDKDGKIKQKSIYAFLSSSDFSNYLSALYTCEKYVEINGKIDSVNPFRDKSYIFQLVRLSFLIIVVLSLIAIIYFLFLLCITKDIERIKYLYFYSASAVISMIFIYIITPMTIYFGKRYIRDLGSAYNALLLTERVKSSADGTL